MTAMHRRSELQNIRELEDVSGTRIFIGDGEHPFGGCGTWFEGIIVYVDDCAPGPANGLNLDCTKRVTSIEMKCRNDVELFDIVSDFSELKSLYIQRRPARSSGSEVTDPFVESLIAFRNTHPNVKVVYWGSDE